ncbi:repressible alkaline phosphatase [[Candida] anglica]
MGSQNESLLGGEFSSVYNQRIPKKKKSWIMFVFESLNFLLVGGLLFYVYSETNASPVGKKHSHGPSKKNIIFMVTDGMGPASLSLARSFKQQRDNLSIDDILELDHHLIGSSRTRSSDSLITDSAAGATAFACGLKSYNGAIGVNPDKIPCGTILEALKLQGYFTGLVVTTRITDATPASFSAHVDSRSQEDLIAEQQLGDSPLNRVVDLIIGGGRCHFLPPSIEGGCRADERNLVEEAQAQGWSYVESRTDFDYLQNGDNVTLPLLGLVAEKDIPYDIDRNASQYPSLAEQAKVALTALSKASEDSDQGFFLMIEGSRIDHAGHDNDPAAQVREVLAFDDAFKQVLEFIDETDTETIVISTSDHETGGLATAKQVDPAYPQYLWYPEVLLNSTHSGEYLTKKILDYANKDDVQQFSDFISKEILEKDMGILDYTEEELSLVKNADKSNLSYALNNLISIRSQTGWSTHGHSAVDVNIYAYTNSKEIRKQLLQGTANHGLLGNHENTEIGSFLERLTGVDLRNVTELIKDIRHAPSASELAERSFEEGSLEKRHHLRDL